MAIKDLPQVTTQHTSNVQLLLFPFFFTLIEFFNLRDLLSIIFFYEGAIRTFHITEKKMYDEQSPIFIICRYSTL